MSEDLHDIDDIFKSAIEPMEETPSDQVWSAVDSGIDKFNIESIKKKYNIIRRLVFVLLFTLLAVVIYTVRISNNFYKSEDAEKTDVYTDTVASLTEISKLSPEKPEIKTAKTDDAGSGDKQKAAISEKLIPTVNGKKLHSINPDKGGQAEIYTEKIALKTTSQEEDISTQKNKGLKLARSAKARTSVSIFMSQPDDSVSDQLVQTDRTREIYSPEKIIIEKPKPAVNLKNPIDLKPAQKREAVYVVKNKKKFPLSATLFFSPTIASTSLRSEGNSRHTSIEEIREGEIEHISFSTGLLVDHPLSKNWSIESGITYSAKSSAMKPRKIFAYYSPAGDIKYKFECSMGYWYVKPKAGTNPGVGDSIYSDESTMLLKYISVPLSVKYNWPMKRFTLFAGAGTSLNILMNGKIKSEIEGTYTEQETNEKIYGLRKSYFSGIISAGVEYSVTKRFSLSFSPAFNFAINSVTKDIPVKSYLNSLGFSGGVKVKF